jgi:hypothetical protein
MLYFIGTNVPLSSFLYYNVFAVKSGIGVVEINKDIIIFIKNLETYRAFSRKKRDVERDEKVGIIQSHAEYQMIT